MLYIQDFGGKRMALNFSHALLHNLIFFTAHVQIGFGE